MRRELPQINAGSMADIAIQSHRSADYETYVRVQDHLRKAYTNLRNRYAEKVYKMSYTDLVKEEKKKDSSRSLMRERIKSVQKKYPLLISDSRIEN